MNSVINNNIKIITGHGSKGLQWKVVYLLGVDDLGFNDKLYDSKLIYIGITRARELLRILYLKENDFIKRLLELNNKNQ